MRMYKQASFHWLIFPRKRSRSQSFPRFPFMKMAESEGPGGESNFPYILLNEIQTMFSQLAKEAKQSVRFWSADMLPTRA